MRAVSVVCLILGLIGTALVASPATVTAATDAQLHACRNRVLEQYPGTAESNVGATQVWESNGSVRIDWYNGPGRYGTCVVGPKDQMFEFIVNGQPQPPYHGAGGSGSVSNLQNFGNIPHLGQFAAVNNSGRFANGIVYFLAYVNGNGPSQYGARCTNGRLYYPGDEGEVRDSYQARYVVAYVCNGGPPISDSNGNVNFGKVPGIGDFSVVNGSGHGGGGVVYFQAYVNGSGPQNWMTSCESGQLGQDGQYFQYSPQAQYVSSYICNGGPPGGGWYRTGGWWH